MTRLPVTDIAAVAEKSDSKQPATTTALWIA
jgi:hypothetical protein